MYFSKFASLAVFASLTTSILAAPKPFPQAASPVAGDGPGKPDRYEQPGGAAQREDLRAKGGDLLDYAIATQENSQGNRGHNTVQSNYPHGDLNPDGTPKTGGSTNCGPFKNNIASILAACSFSTKNADDICKILNTDVGAAVKCQRAQRDYFGAKFYETQRCGHVCDHDTTCGKSPYPCAAEGQYYKTAVDFMVKIATAADKPNNNTVGNYKLHDI